MVEAIIFSPTVGCEIKCADVQISRFIYSIGFLFVYTIAMWISFVWFFHLLKDSECIMNKTYIIRDQVVYNEKHFVLNLVQF